MVHCDGIGQNRAPTTQHERLGRVHEQDDILARDRTKLLRELTVYSRAASRKPNTAPPASAASTEA